jgi:hypothetical protein
VEDGGVSSGPEDDAPVLPDQTRDDTDDGWGSSGTRDGAADEWYERERPPHWE